MAKKVRESADQVEEQDEVKKSTLQEGIDSELTEKDNKKKTQEELGDEAWNKFVKKVNLGDIIDDQLLRAISRFKDAYLEKNPNEILDFSLKLNRIKNKSHLFAAVELRFEMHRNGTVYPIQVKKIEFKHIREAREGHMWKAVIYEAMFQALVYFGLTYIMLKNDVDTGRIKPAAPTGSAGVTES